MILGLPWEVLAVSPWQALGGGSPILSRGRVSSCLCPSFCKQKACGGAVLLILSQRWKPLRLYCVVVGQLFYHGRLHCFSVFMFSSLVLSEVRSKFVWNNGLEMRESRSTQEIYWERGKLNWKKNTAPVSSQQSPFCQFWHVWHQRGKMDCTVISCGMQGGKQKSWKTWVGNPSTGHSLLMLLLCICHRASETIFVTLINFPPCLDKKKP